MDKLTRCLWILPLTLAVSALAQGPSTRLSWRATARDTVSTTHEATEIATNALTGQVTERTNRYTEVSSGRNYLDETGQWVESQDLVELTPDGGAAAVHGPAKVHFKANLNSAGAITLTTASNRVFETRPLALVFYDAQSGRVALIAAVQNCVGELVPPNQVVYKSAFGPLADVRLVYTKAGVESDLVLLQQPVLPTGWDPKTTRLELWHEWIVAPNPREVSRVLHRELDSATREAMVEPDLIDHILDFDDLWLPTGAAYSSDDRTGDPNVARQVRVPEFAHSTGQIPVAKSWLNLTNRAVLVESVRWEAIEPKLQRLPPGPQATAAGNRMDCLSQLPAPMTAGPSGQAITESRSVYSPNGVVLDWIAVSGSGAYTFTNATYFVSSSTYFSGTLTFQPNCVIKFAPDAYLLTYGSIVCNGSSGSPSILTSGDDDLFGETLPSSTHTPGYAASQAVWDYFTPYGSTFQGMRIRWAYTGIQMDSYAGGTVTNCTFELCQTGVYGQWGGYVTASVCGVEAPYSPTDVLSGNITDFCTGDADYDGLPDVWEYQYWGSTSAGSSADSDGDGLTNYQEYQLGTNPVRSDTDGDGMPDGWEVTKGFNPLVNDASDDPDGDWVTNLQEYQGGTNPHDVMVVAWGDNASGQCEMRTNLVNAWFAAGGLSHTMVLQSNGVVTTWGNNTYNQTNLPSGLTNAVAISSGPYHSLAARSDGTVSIWGSWWPSIYLYPVTNLSGLTGVVRVAAGAAHDVALRNDGSVVAWGYDTNVAYTQVPTNLSPAKAVAAGWEHSVSLASNGTVAVGGLNHAEYGWNVTTIPTGLSNVIAVACGGYHTLALKADGTVVAWGAGNQAGQIFGYGQSIVPAGLSNVIAVAAGGFRSLALQVDGTIVGWGYNLYGQGTAPPGVSNLIAIAAGPNHTLAIRNGRQTPIILLNPINQATPAGSNVTFTASGVGLAGVHYQWQSYGTNIVGATNATLTLTNVQANNAGNYQVIISTGAGSVTSSSATFTLITPPVLISQTEPERQWAPLYPLLNLAVNVSSPFLNYQWKLNGTPIAGATGSNYSVFPFGSSDERHYSVTVTNEGGITNSRTWKVRALNQGGVAAWGSDSQGQLDWPANATNVIAVAAGGGHSLAVREDGSVLGWGLNDSGQTNAPTLTNAIAVAAGNKHNLALRDNGTVVAWGRNNETQTNVPSGLTNIIAVAAGGNQSLALLRDGTLMRWGAQLGSGLASVSNVTAIAVGTNFGLALLSNRTVAAWGDTGSPTNVPSAASNVVAIAAGDSHALALKENGTIVAWGANGSGQTNVPNGLSNVMAVAAGRAHSVALKNDGTVVVWGDNSLGQTNVGAGLKWIKSIAAGGDHTLAAVFSELVQYQVDVSKDLLLIYNTNSTDSSNVCYYYMQHRPMVNGANVLPLGCTTNEMTSPTEFTNQIGSPLSSWLAANPTKRPQYLVVFLRVPTTVNDTPVDDAVLFAAYTNNGSAYPASGVHASVSVQLRSLSAGWQPFINYINMGDASDCVAYINKLKNFGATNSPGKFLLSASAGGYGNTNYYFDENFPENGVAKGARDAVIAAGVDPSAVIFDNTTNVVGIGSNVVGYLSWGMHAFMGGDYARDGTVVFTGNSGWFLIETIESANGQRWVPDHGNYLDWFSINAFGGTNYSHIPIGAVAHVNEPGGGGWNGPSYFSLWSRGRNFGMCAWGSRATDYFLAVGDPFVKR